jgi:hypothetical protein
VKERRTWDDCALIQTKAVRDASCPFDKALPSHSELGRSRRKPEQREGKNILEMKMKATWQPHERHGELTKRGDLPDSVFAFPKQRKEPLTDVNHVRDAIARFDQTIDVSDEDRELAFANIRKAANYYGIDMTETDWTQLGRSPHTGRTAEDRKKSALKAAATRKKRE